jgi:phosphoglycolate phosphatase-like HAD superfamily hydrolase
MVRRSAVTAPDSPGHGSVPRLSRRMSHPCPLRGRVAGMRAVVWSEQALASTDRLFADAVAHVARKLGRVKPLDASSLPPARGPALAALAEWAGSEVSSWEQELCRFYEEHLPIYVRPDPALNAGARALAAAGVRLGAWSAGPADAFAALLHQLALGRRLDATLIDASPRAPLRLAAELGVEAVGVVVVTVDPPTASAAADAGMRVVHDSSRLQQLVA